MGIKLALLGGTFNPIHMGHLFLAEEVLRSLHYERVAFVPSYRPAHKSLNPADDPRKRLEMVKLAIEGRDEFFVEDCEILRASTSYTMDTVDYLQVKCDVEGKIGLVIGDDLVPGFRTWKMVDRLLSTVRVVIAHRSTPERLPFPGDHVYLENAVLPISSSDIRARVRGGKAFRYLVPEKIYEYIREERLYLGR